MRDHGRRRAAELAGARALGAAGNNGNARDQGCGGLWPAVGSNSTNTGRISRPDGSAIPDFEASMAKLTPLQQAAAVATIVGAAIALVGLLRWSAPSVTTGVKQTGTGVGSGRDTVFNGPVQFGTGNLAGPQQVQLSCEWSQIPKLAPQNGIYELELIGSGRAEFVSSSLAPGTEMNTPAPGVAPSYSYLCRFLNLGAAAIVNFEAEFAGHFMKVVREEHSTKSGETVGPPFKVITPRTSVGAGDKFEFYIRNYSPFYAQVDLPTTARDKVVGNDPGNVFGLTPTQRRGFSMPPFERP
jgi:hypothetical protein